MSALQSPQLPLREYRFYYEAVREIKISPFPGLMLHGAFGHALYTNQFGTSGQQASEESARIDNCGYSYLFRNPGKQDSGQISGLDYIPSPLVMRFTRQDFSSVPARHRFHFDLVLVGDANRCVDEVIAAMHALGEHGIHKQPARLSRIEQLQADSLPQNILGDCDHLPAVQPTPPEMPEKINISFIAPYILSKQQRQQSFDCQQWIMGIIRRISLLQSNYTDTPATADFKNLKQQAGEIQIHRSGIYYYETSHSKKNHYSGLLGSFDVSLTQTPELWPWLYLGQWLNNGKRTSYGFGGYRISRASQI